MRREQVFFMTDSKTASNKTLTWIIEGVIIVLAVLLGLAIRWGVYESAIIISRSMSTTLLVGDRLLIDHRNSLHGQWRRGDIIAFTPPPAWASNQNNGDAVGDQYVKRVIGLPGETIDVRAGAAVINGKSLNEPYLNKTPCPDEGPLHMTLGPDQYFVMGDNRANSEDARDHGPIANSDINGRAVRILAPFSRMGSLPSPDYDLAP